MAPLPPALARALPVVARRMAAVHAPWWIIGSAAMALHGVAVDARDIDILLDPRDARDLVARGVARDKPPGPPGRFRSTVHAGWREDGIEVELMADLRVRTADGWVPVRPAARHAIWLDGALLHLPSIADLATMCALFARPKDAERGALLAALSCLHQPRSP